MIRRRSVPRVPCLLFISCSILLGFSPVLISAAVVTLGSIEIFKTHEWIPTKPTVYFHCKGENKIELPDVKDKRVTYTFKGEESWQPLTELKNLKCKRCGFYEKDALKPDEELDEWELCAEDFTSDGKYTHFKDKDFNATFICPECVALVKGPDNTPKPKEKSKGLMHWGLIIIISCAASFLFIVGLIAGCKYWQKRKRQQQQAQFLKLFEDNDDIEDELGIGPLSHTI